MDISCFGEMKIQQDFDSDQKSPGDLFLTSKKVFEVSNPYQLDTLIQKHGERRMKGLFQPEEALKEIFYLLRIKLTSFQNAHKIVDFWYKGGKEIKNSMIMKQWNVLFHSIQDPELKWLLSLEKHLIRGWKNTRDEYPKELSDVQGAFLGKRSLSKAMIDQMFSSSGSFKKDTNLTGRLDVARFPQQNPVFYLKKSPEIPGYEYAATLFMRSLGLKNIPFSELLLFKDPKEDLYPVLLTQAVPGNTVDEIWDDDSNFTSLDPHSTHLLILCSMLLNPEDGKGDNYILTPDKKRIIPIDSDHAFLPGIIQEEKGLFIWKTIFTELQSKTVLYCLHEMNKPIPLSVVQIFKELDVDKFIETWLNKLVCVNDKYQNLPPKTHLSKAGDDGTFFRIAFPQESIKNLYSKFYRMQQYLSEQKNITPFNLLKSLEPYVGKLYHNAFLQESTVLKRFMKVTDSLYQRDLNDHQISRLNSIQMFKILYIPKEELIGESFLCKADPCNILHNLPQFKKEITQTEGDYQKILKGEIELKKIDVSDSSETEEIRILSSLIKNNPEVIAYHNSRYISVKNLRKIFKPLNVGLKLRFLDFRGAKNFGPNCVEEIIAPSFPNLEYLNLSNNPLLKLGMFLQEDFQNLKRLVISHCPNLNCIVIASSMLDMLEISHNENFTRILLDVPNLTYFDFTASRVQDAIYFFHNAEKIQIIKPSFNEIRAVVFYIQEFLSEAADQLTIIETEQTESDQKLESVLNEKRIKINTQDPTRIEFNQNETLHDLVERAKQLEAATTHLIWKDLSETEVIFRLLEKTLDSAEEFYIKPFEMLQATKSVLERIMELKKRTQVMSEKKRELNNKIQNMIKKMEVQR